jgi:hypothetical protein
MRQARPARRKQPRLEADGELQTTTGDIEDGRITELRGAQI